LVREIGRGRDVEERSLEMTDGLLYYHERIMLSHVSLWLIPSALSPHL